MSFLTTFPEQVYPTHDLAGAVAAEPHDEAGLQACMWLAQLSYEDPSIPAQKDMIDRIMQRWGFHGMASFNRGGIVGFVAESQSCLVVSFAGTDPLVAANWVTDFDIRVGRNGVHRGFARGVKLVWPNLLAVLAATCKPVILVGHSLGGALAVVAAWRLSQLPASSLIGADRIARVVTFGAPRAGTEDFARSYRAQALWDRTVRLHYGRDIVPFVPPAAIGGLPYRHVGHVLRCPRGDRFACSHAAAEADEALPNVALEDLDSLRGRWSHLAQARPGRFPAGAVAAALADTLPFFLRDHLQDCYLTALGWSFTTSPTDDQPLGPDHDPALPEAIRRRIGTGFDDLAEKLRMWLRGA